MNTDLIAYYKDRAAEYEHIYQKPERLEDLVSATTLLQDVMAGRQILEIACGTGYWTERIAATASTVYATDINESVIRIAREKNYPRNNVQLAVSDLYHLSSEGKFNALFGGFIWSHIGLKELDKFLDAVHQSVLPGSAVVFMDNNYVAGSNHPITETDQDGNTYQTRTLSDGSTHRVLKNFPTEEFLRSSLDGLAEDISIINLKYYWLLIYKTAQQRGEAVGEVE